MAADMSGQPDALEHDRRLRLQEHFTHVFADTGVELPAPAAAYGRPGWIRQSGWRVSFIWSDDSQYLEYEASWGLAGDQIHRRLWADGHIDELDAMNEFAVAPIEADVAAAIAETGNYNRGIERALIARGLLPWPHISFRHEAWSERGLWSSLDLTPNALLALATDAASDAIDSALPKPSFLESKIETALLTAIGDRIDPGLLGARKREFEIPDWTGDIRGIDLYIRDPAGGLCVGCELKVDDVQWTLWDLFKLVNTFALPTVDAAFLVVAAPRHTWASDRPYTPFFDLPPGAALRWTARDTIEWWPSAWKELLAGGPARPVKVPAEFEVEAIAHAAVPAYPGYELRTIAVRPASGSGYLPLKNGWPINE
jgi:hypothetical protein